jgi:hypothetical protein
VDAGDRLTGDRSRIHRIGRMCVDIAPVDIRPVDIRHLDITFIDIRRRNGALTLLA